jgi:LPXTG-site transpeptidase (sortase) family protein
MSEPIKIGLDNPAFKGRLRTVNSRQVSRRPVTYSRTKYDNYISEPTIRQRAAESISYNQQPPLQKPEYSKEKRNLLSKFNFSYSRGQLVLMSLAVLVLGFGITISIQAEQVNHKASTQVAALSKQADNNSSSNSSLPSTVKPSAAEVRNYQVGPDQPRYIGIPAINVNARVMQTGVNSEDVLGTPSNVYDTAWYTGSAEPGQDGATLIDGHVSSWTTKGVFYNLDKLVFGDAISITKGNGQVVNYKVIKSETYDSNNVDMKAALTTITGSQSSLNLISCTGSYQKSTGQFNKRIIVFATETS